MQRSITLLACLLILATAIPVAAHVNDVEADNQVSVDGEIAVESTSVPEDGFLVVHRVTESGDPGEPIGHVSLQAGRQYDRLTVGIDQSVWSSWGDAREVYLVVHTSGGGAGFSPDDDPIQRVLGSIAGKRITVARGDAAAYVRAEDFAPREVRDSVTIREVAAPRDARLEVRVREATGPGPVLGAQNLSAGHHENVTVDLTRSPFTNSSSVSLIARLTAPNGTPLRAGGEVIQSGVPVVDADGDSGPRVVTPSDPTTTVQGPVTTEEGAPSGQSTTTGDGPGFAVPATLLALGVSLLAVRARERN